MKLSNKIYVHFLTILLFFVSFLTGYAKYLFFIFLIVIIHELGHIFIAKIFKRKIVKVELLPFGGLTKMESLISENIFEDLLVAVGGILTQSLFGFYLKWLNLHCTIHPATFMFLEDFNKTMILFNLIPIYPLDGYKILKLSLELFIPFKLTFVIAEYFSIIVLVTILLFNTDLVTNNIFIFAFIGFMIFKEIKEKKYVFLRFYLERLHYDFNFKRKDINDYKKMYKNKINYINGKHEKLILHELFSRKIY